MNWYNLLFSFDIVGIIKITETLLSALLFIAIFIYRTDATKEVLQAKSKIQTALVGLVANFGDTFGIGSFATLIASRRLFKLMPNDKQFLGVLNIQAVFTSALQSIIFLNYVNVSPWLIVLPSIMVILGGALAGYVVVHVQVKFIRNVMFYAFIIVAIILLLNQLHFLHVNDNHFNELTGIRLAIFSVVMFFVSFLPAFGVGFYSVVQVIIFLLGVNPLVAFPIMTTTSTMQTIATSFVFVRSGVYYLKSALILMASGLVGVAIAGSLVTHINTYYLKWILLVVVFYNIFMLRTRSKSKK